MILFLKTFSISLVSFTILDFLWFRFGVKDFNLRELSSIGRITDGKFDVLLLPAVLTYALMSIGIAVFLAPFISQTDPWWKTFLWGALFGLIIYGVYDMTNLAILKNYPIKFMIVDMSWGTFSFGVVACLCRAVG